MLMLLGNYTMRLQSDNLELYRGLMGSLNYFKKVNIVQPKTKT